MIGHTLIILAVNHYPNISEMGGTFEILLPSSGFASLNDIRSYLLQYYTETWVDTGLSGGLPRDWQTRV